MTGSCPILALILQYRQTVMMTITHSNLDQVTYRYYRLEFKIQALQDRRFSYWIAY